MTVLLLLKKQLKRQVICHPKNIFFDQAIFLAITIQIHLMMIVLLQNIDRSGHIVLNFLNLGAVIFLKL